VTGAFTRTAEVFIERQYIERHILACHFVEHREQHVVGIGIGIDDERRCAPWLLAKRVGPERHRCSSR
jgi:hypothetical protein